MIGLDVKIWMLTEQIKAREIAKSYGCSDAFLSQFLKGVRTSEGVTKILIKKGCPKKFFKNNRIAA